MSKLFIISEEEKNRILNLHESATKNHYLSEQVVTNYDGKYDYKKDGDKYFFKLKNTNNWKEATGNPLNAIKTKVFKNTTTNNIKKDGRKVSKFDIKNKEFFTQTKDTTGDTMRSFNQHNYKMIEDGKKSIELMGKISEKTHNQLVSMIEKGSLKKDTFIVVNKDNAIATLFGPNYKFIGKSSITSGRQKDVKPVNIDEKTYKDWFIRSLNFAKKNPSHKDSVKINKWIQDIKKKTNIVKNDGSIDFDDYRKFLSNKKISKFPYSYQSTLDSGSTFTPSGIYSIGSPRTEKGYSGSESTNLFPLVDIKTGEEITSALHGFAGGRRGDLIKQFSKQDVNSSKPTSRDGWGCVNVDEQFIKLVNQYKPKYVVILPDSGQLVDVKIVSMETWSEKIVSLGEKCVKSFISLFT